MQTVSYVEQVKRSRIIYEASTGRPAPDFFASDEDALADILRCAGVHS